MCTDAFGSISACHRWCKKQAADADKAAPHPVMLGGGLASNLCVLVLLFQTLLVTTGRS